jgi:hypothetical protein
MAIDRNGRVCCLDDNFIKGVGEPQEKVLFSERMKVFSRSSTDNDALTLNVAEELIITGSTEKKAK